MAILVTGGLGFVGSHFIWAAVGEGAEVVVLDDGSGGEPATLPKGVTSVRGDIGDEKLVRELIRRHRADAVVHFAGKIQVGESMREPEIYFDVNIVRSLALLEAVRKEKVERFVFSSSAAVYGHPATTPIPESSETRPVNPYGATKLGFEFALKAYGDAHGLRWAALRYFNAAGALRDGTLRESHDPETHLIPLVIDAGLGRRPPPTVFGTDYPTPDGTCVRDYIHVTDLADGHLRALGVLEKANVGAVNLGTGRGFSVKEVLEATRKVLGRDIPFTEGPRRRGDPPSLVADPAVASKLLGWEPTSSDIHTIVEDALRSRR